MEEVVFQTKNLCFNSKIKYADLKIYKGKINFIKGESGTGKSTLLKLLNTTLSPENGEIIYNDKNIEDISTLVIRNEVLLVSQDVFLFDTTIKENFVKFYEYCGKPMPNDDEIKYFLKLCCIDFPVDKDCTTMSGGERQRIYISIYLSFIPKVFMLDEPTSALDSRNSQDVIENIISFCREKDITVVIISHDNKLTDKYGENIITIEKEAI